MSRNVNCGHDTQARARAPFLNTCLVLGISLFLGPLLLEPAALASDYVFQNRGLDGESFGDPDLSNNGISVSTFLGGVFTSQGGGIGAVIYNPGVSPWHEPWGGSPIRPRVNSRGEAVFGLGSSDTTGDPVALVRSDESGLTPIVVVESALPGSGFVAFGAADINDARTVAFAAERTDGSVGIFLEPGHGIRSLVDTSDGLFTDVFGGLAINSRGKVAFFGTTASGEPGIFLASENGTVPVVSHGFAGFSGSLALSDSDQIAFYGQQDVGAEGVFLADVSGVLRAVALRSSTSDRWAHIDDSPGVDGRGRVAFIAVRNDGSGQRALYIDSPYTQREIIREGQHFDLQGQPAELQFLVSGANSLNQRGEVAFYAGLQIAGPYGHPTEGILVASTAPAPESAVTCTSLRPYPASGLPQVLRLRTKLRETASGRTALVTAAPQLRVFYRPNVATPQVDVSTEILTTSQSLHGLDFRSDPQGWSIGVLTDSLEDGLYHFLLHSGNSAEYQVAPLCGHGRAIFR